MFDTNDALEVTHVDVEVALLIAVNVHVIMVLTWLASMFDFWIIFPLYADSPETAIDGSTGWKHGTAIA